MIRSPLLAFVVGAVLLPRFVRGAEPNKVECVTADDAAQELRRAGKLHQARETLLLCGSTSCPALVREDCVQRMAEVDGAMPTTTFEARDSEGNALVLVTVTMDGQRVTDHLDGQPVQVDPGEHRLVFESAGLPTIERTVVVREGEKNVHEGVVFGTPLSPTTPASSPSEIGPQRALAMALAGAGVVGVVVGSVLGLVSRSTYNHALQTECNDNPNGCSPAGIQDGRSAHGQAAASTAMFVAGGALLGAGAVLWITARRAEVGIRTEIGSDHAGLVVAGRW